MFSLSFIVISLIAFGVLSQASNINTLPANNLEKGYPFGKLRLSEDGKNEELISPNAIEVPRLNQDSSANIQPLPSPCIGARPSTKLVHPKDKSKYIQCRDEYHYEIFTCPNGGEYNDQTNSCTFATPIINKCEQEKPCLNGGHCILLSNSTFKCTCRQDWTGDRCETPLTSCVQKPCGPNAECRSLKTTDYQQDYVCVCHGPRGYGLNCQEVVPNPCLSSSEQFFSYAFSQRAYIQCDGELIYFQPCAPLLYWNQEDKICDRKRSTKKELPTLSNKLVSNNNDNQQGKIGENIKEEFIGTPTVQSEQKNSFISKGKEENTDFLAFVPARVANRQQLLSNMNNQQGVLSQNFREKEQNTQDLSNQLSQPVETNLMRQEFMSQPKQWSSQPVESNIRQPFSSQSGRNQLLAQNTQQQWAPTSTERILLHSNMGEVQFRSENQQQQQTLPQQNQAFGTQQWLNQLPDVKLTSSHRFDTQPQSWQGSQTLQNQPQFQNQNQQTLVETSTTAPNVVHLQGFNNQNTREQEQSWQNRPINTQLMGNQVQQSNRFLTQQQPWQNQGNNQMRQTFVQPEASSINTQRLAVNNEQSFTDQSLQNQPWTQTVNSESTDFNNGQLQGIGGTQPSNFPQQNQAFNSQQRFNQVQDIKPQNNQRIATQPWQGSQTLQNQQTFVSTSTEPSNVFHLQGFQKLPEQEQSWRNQIQNQPIRPQSNQIFAFKPTQWSETPKQKPQENTFTSQTWSQNQQPLTTDGSSALSNTQFGFNQLQNGLSSQNLFEEKQPWSNNQQIQKSQLANFGDLKIQTTQDFAARPVVSSQTQPWLSTGPLNGNSFETTTNANKGILQGLSAQNSRGQQPVQQDTNVPTEQRKTLDSMPTSLSGSWQSRS